MNINFNEPCSVHFIGIGGVSMSGLASILQLNGFEVSGSDIQDSDIVNNLIEKGIKVNIPQDEKYIRKDLDLVVYTVAVKEDNPELKKARELGLNIVDRATLLGAIMKNYEHNICIAGTHGKTTTTSMISHIYLEAKKDPTILVGGTLPIIDNNYYVGSDDFIISEACEYFDSFLKFDPSVSIILNIEADHLDYFGNLENVQKSFVNFSNKTTENGILILDHSLRNIKGMTEGKTVQTFSIDDEKADFFADNICFDELGFPSFDLIQNGEFVDRFSLSVTGLHNVQNALSAIACALHHGVDIDSIARGLMGFKGAKRRFEYKGFINDLAIVDDYAHHPTEIEATITAARNCCTGKIVVLFQPHTYTRTLSLLREFGESLAKADEVLLIDIYSAREKDLGEIHSKDLKEEVLKHNKNAYYFSDEEKLKKYILNSFGKNDMLITMGAGNVYLIGEQILNR